MQAFIKPADPFSHSHEQDGRRLQSRTEDPSEERSVTGPPEGSVLHRRRTAAPADIFPAQASLRLASETRSPGPIEDVTEIFFK
ncbi:MAG: hypothetical protein Kow00104_06730 [Rhodothalassiaceae bacterium]